MVFINFYIFIFLLLSFTFFFMLFIKLNIIILFMLMEIAVFYVNLNFIMSSLFIDDVYGIVFSLFIVSVSGTELGLGLSFLIVLYGHLGSVFFDNVTNVKS